MYVFNTVNKRILITANNCIHIISANFLDAASDKRMRLLTSRVNLCAAVDERKCIRRREMMFKRKDNIDASVHPTG